MTEPPANCFPEPATQDLELGRRGEFVDAWLRRSTMPFAVELRAFLNGNLALLPPDIADALCRSMRGPKFRATCFELVVARTLALTGARELHYERATASGRRPDLTAVYPDGEIAVDATTPEFDREIVEDQRQYEPLIGIIEAEVANPWGFWAERLPHIGPNESRAEFKRAIRSQVAQLRDIVDDDDVVLRSEYRGGEIRIRWLRRDGGWGKAHLAGPSSGAYGDTERVVAATLHRKRSQLRVDRPDAPPIVAIAGGLGDAREDFDIAFFGRTAGASVIRSGEWGREKEETERSVIAGALVYPRWEWTIGHDPILYVNPRYDGAPLPRAMLLFERRELRPHQIAETPATFGGVFAALRAAAGLEPRMPIGHRRNCGAGRMGQARDRMGRSMRRESPVYP
jgi:hypothetical protein